MNVAMFSFYFFTLFLLPLLSNTFLQKKLCFFEVYKKKNGYNRYSSVCVLGQLTRKSFSVARVKAV